MTAPMTERASAAAYTPPSTVDSRQAAIAAAIGCIITGRPFPAHLRPQPMPAARPVATVEDGLARIVRGA